MITDKFINKIVATRGIGSGVNVGLCIEISGCNLLLAQGSYFLPDWKYEQSHGAFHSLSKADVKGGTITEVEGDTIITDLAQCVICDDKIMDILKGFAK